MPTVSVIMPIYNGAAYLRDAIDSLLGQTFSDFDIWAIDDGSKDASPAILASYSDPRLHVYRQPNAGQTMALNRGLSLAAGDYIARLDQDDLAETDRLAQQVEFLDTHPEVGLLGSDFTYIDADGQPIRRIGGFTTDRDLRYRLVIWNPFAHSAVMFRRRLVEQVGPYVYDARYPQFQDYDLWIRMAAHSQIASLPFPLTRIRVHRQSSSAQADDAALRCRIEVRAKAIRELHLPVWLWWYVYKSKIGLWLPLKWRNRTRRLLGLRTNESDR
jgi:glycosyltransferase involved in cell wall biosynthesis